MLRHTKSRFVLALPLLLALALLPARVSAQSPTGLISGHVTSTDHQALPGATVTIASPALQQPQTRVTSPNGDYLFKFLLPGEYTVTVQLVGFTSVKDVRNVAATEPVVMDFTLQVQAVSNEITVTAPADAFVNTVLAASNFKQELINTLPTARTVLSSVNLAPATHDTGPNGDFTIGGAASYENIYQINGVETQDNLRGDPLSLYIEDAIQETTVMTSGLSADYGRFSGGVVNTVTKSGGNMFSGSFRESFTNDNWRSVSPFGEPKVDQTVPESEFTFGGPIIANHTWFFGAGRIKNDSTGQQTAFTSIPYTEKTDETRFEGKITQALGATQRLEVGDIGIRETDHNFAPPGGIMDLASLVTRQTPQNLFSAHYTGSFGPHFFVESQFSDRHFAFVGAGGTSTDLIQGTMLLDQQTGATYWSPQFCGVCGNENRDNNDFVVKGTYFLSTGAGAHNVVFGYDTFNDVLSGDNHQSGSDWHIWTTSTQIVNSTVFPVIAGGPDGFSTYIINWPISESSQGTNFRTHALFANDTWTISRHFSTNLGLRYDRNRGLDSAGNVIANGTEISPRLGLVWDPTGNGTTTFDVTGGRYVDAVANNIANETSPAGIPSILAYFYQGPDINTDPTQPLIPTDQAIRDVFNWYDANQPAPFQATVPGVSTQVRQSLKSPHADEVTAGVSRQIGTHGALRADFVDRKFADFYAERTDTTTGQITDDLGNVYDLRLLENTNLLKRTYKALDVQGNYHAGQNVTLGASYTLSALRGNADEENLNSGPVPDSVLSYPEYFDMSWSDPVGDLTADQRHKGRAWATVTLPWFDHLLTMSVIQQAESGSPYAAVGQIDTTPYVTNPGYLTPPQGAVNYYFSARDAFHTAAMYRTDLGINLNRELAHGHGVAPQVFAQFQVLNLFNQFQIFNITGAAINTKVLTAVDDPTRFAPFNPFTETPVQGVNWDYSTKFGTPTDATAYTLPRTFKCSVGIRF